MLYWIRCGLVQCRATFSLVLRAVYAVEGASAGAVHLPGARLSFGRWKDARERQAILAAVPSTNIHP
jgi:hypothetical protein